MTFNWLAIFSRDFSRSPLSFLRLWEEQSILMSRVKSVTRLLTIIGEGQRFAACIGTTSSRNENRLRTSSQSDSLLPDLIPCLPAILVDARAGYRAAPTAIPRRHSRRDLWEIISHSLSLSISCRATQNTPSFKAIILTVRV